MIPGCRQPCTSSALLPTESCLPSDGCVRFRDLEGILMRTAITRFLAVALTLPAVSSAAPCCGCCQAESAVAGRIREVESACCFPQRQLSTAAVAIPSCADCVEPCVCSDQRDAVYPRHLPSSQVRQTLALAAISPSASASVLAVSAATAAGRPSFVVAEGSRLHASLSIWLL